MHSSRIRDQQAQIKVDQRAIGFEAGATGQQSQCLQVFIFIFEAEVHAWQLTDRWRKAFLSKAHTTHRSDVSGTKYNSISTIYYFNKI